MWDGAPKKNCANGQETNMALAWKEAELHKLSIVAEGGLKIKYRIGSINSGLYYFQETNN